MKLKVFPFRILGFYSYFIISIIMYCRIRLLDGPVQHDIAYTAQQRWMTEHMFDF